MNIKKFADEAGAWHHFLVQELRKKQCGEDYHRPMVMAALRHLRRYCSSATFDYYHDAYTGLNIVM